jgi:molybdopterin-binding protein
MLKVNNIYKTLGVFNLKDVSLQVNKGEYFILLGPSGAGKSIILEIIAGLIRPDSGSIEINNTNINHKRIQERNVGLVFQDLALFPHLSVRQNIAFPLLRKGRKRLEINRMITEVAKNLSITHLLRRYPTTLSGGEQQRVALARTLVTKPDLLLLDEPLSSLDVELRAEIRKLLREINRNGQTIIHVTHDYEEAIALAQRIAVMNDGIIEQIGTPQEVFSKPISSFVAGFGGVKNFFEVKAVTSNNVDLTEVLIGNHLSVNLLGEACNEGYITFPENAVSISSAPLESSSQNCFKGKVIDIYPQRFGVEVVTNIGVNVYSLVTQESIQKLGIEIGSEVWVSFKASSVRFIGE